MGLLPSFIRIAKIEDATLLSRWMGSKEFSDFCGFTPLYFYSYRLEQSLRNAIQSQSSFFFLVNEDRHGNGKDIGFIALTEVDLICQKAEASTYFEQAGGFSRGISYVFDYAFHILKLNKIKAEVIESNKRVISMLEKNGYLFEGRYQKKIFRHGKARDTLLYALFAKDHKALPNSKLHHDSIPT